MTVVPRSLAIVYNLVLCGWYAYRSVVIAQWQREVVFSML